MQLTSGRDKAANLEKTEQLVARAASTGADVVALPEKWNVIGPPDVLHDMAETIDDGESVAAMRNWARAHGVTLIGGSITERREGREKLSNTCLVFGPDGELASVYRKIHLFDVDVGDGATYRESASTSGGDAPLVLEVNGVKVGLSICYDLRFPELYRSSRDLGVTHRDRARRVHASRRARTTGTCSSARARSRTRSYVVAPLRQWRDGRSGGRRPTGSACIVDPWGDVLAQAPDEETVISAELDRAWLEEVRRRLPSLSQRRPEAYRWPTPA